MSLKEKLIKNSTIDFTSTLEDSKIYSKKDMIPTSVPIINIALSGSINGGITPGVTMLAGPSKHFKTGFALLMAAAFLKKYPEGIILFYDSEFGTPQSYFKTFKIPTDSVVHTPVTDVEELKHDISVQLQNLDRNDKVMIVIDSIGNLASKKEVEDAIDGKSVADMTRAKAFKSLFRIITPKLTLKDIPMVVINHTYKEIGLFPKDIVGGGCVDGETLIKMSDGSLKMMMNIIPGDYVITLDGNKKVIDSWTPETLNEGEPETFEITFNDGYKVIVSENHKFLTNRGWVNILDLTKEDEIISAP